MNEVNVIEASKLTDSPSIAIVVSKYNYYIVERLLTGCLSTLKSEGINNQSISIIKVPGAFEIPVTVRNIVVQGKYEAIITLGAIIRGETPHFEIIANNCSMGISAIISEFGLPVIFGVLTVDTSQQAMDRSGDEESNKGSEAAKTAIEMISVLRKLSNE